MLAGHARSSLDRSRYLVLGLLLLLAPPASAIQELTPQPEWRYAVADVAAESWLNVRAAAGVRAAPVGRLAPDAEGIVVTGVRRPVRGQIWWEIPWPTTRSGYAWVNGRYLTPMAPAGERESGFALACSGTEPFWSLRIEEGKAQFDAMDGAAHQWHAGQWELASGRWGDFAVRLVGDGDTEAPGWAAVRRDFRFCSDGMSEFQYPHHILLMTPTGETLSGCCRRRR